jgi:hypothetical protein
MNPQRWALRMVLGSMSAAAALFSVALVLVVLLRASSSQDVNVGTWLSLMGDVLLVFSLLHWLQGRRLRGWKAVLVLTAIAAVPALLLYGLVWPGATPQRGALWLALKSALAAVLRIAAMRVWSRQDLNKVA